VPGEAKAKARQASPYTIILFDAHCCAVIQVIMTHRKPKKKRVFITVTREPYEELRSLFGEAGYKPSYLSEQFDHLVHALLPVARQAKIDALRRKQMTIEEMSERYGKLAEAAMKERLEEG